MRSLFDNNLNNLPNPTLPKDKLLSFKVFVFAIWKFRPIGRSQSLIRYGFL